MTLRSGRTPVLAVIVLAIMAGMLSKAQAQSSPDAAVAIQNNTAHTGAASIPGFSPPLTVKWTFQLPNAPSYPSNILIAEGKVFVSAANYNQNALYALDAQTGSVIWGPVAITNGSSAPAPIAYDEGRIFAVPFTTPNFGYGEMFAYDAGTGALLWQTTLPQQHTFGAPTARNGIVYATGATSGSNLYAVRESDGTLLWNLLLNDGGTSIPAVTDFGVYLSYGVPQIYKFDPKTGKLLWHYRSGGTGGAFYGMPVIYKGKVYDVDLDDQLFQGNSGLILNAGNRAAVGFFAPPPNYFPKPPALSDRRMFCVSESNLFAQGAEGKSMLWSVPNDPNNPFSTPPFVVNSMVYVGTGSSNVSYGPASLFGYDVQTGQQAVALDLSYYCNQVRPMSAAEGILVVPAETYLIAVQKGVGLASISLAASSVTGGQSTQGTVMLNAKAPKGGFTVNLAGLDQTVSVPAMVFIPAGKTTASFTVSTSSVPQFIYSGVKATLGAYTIRALLTIYP